MGEDSRGSKTVSIFIKPLPRDYDEQKLIDLLKPYGEPTSVRIKSKKDYFGFADYEDEEVANNVIKNLNKTKLEDRELTVELSTGKGKSNRGRRSRSRRRESRRSRDRYSRRRRRRSYYSDPSYDYDYSAPRRRRHSYSDYSDSYRRRRRSRSRRSRDDYS